MSKHASIDKRWTVLVAAAAAILIAIAVTLLTTTQSPVADERVSSEETKMPVMVEIQQIPTGSETDAFIRDARQDRLSIMPPQSGMVHSGEQWHASSADGSVDSELFRYKITDGAQDAPDLDCWGVYLAEHDVPPSSRCSRADDPSTQTTRVLDDHAWEKYNISLWDAPEDSVHMSVTTESGVTATGDVSGGVGYAEWLTGHGNWDHITVYNADGDELWTKENRPISRQPGA